MAVSCLKLSYPNSGLFQWLRVVSLDFSSSTWGRIHDFVMLGAVLRSRAFRHMAAQPSFIPNEIIANLECDL